MKPSVLITTCIVIFFFNCKESKYSDDIEDCNAIGDYYDNGTHYIRRDLVTDDGTIDYKKLLEDTKPTNSECYPANHEVK